MILLPIITFIDTFTIVQHDNKKKKKKKMTFLSFNMVECLMNK